MADVFFFGLTMAVLVVLFIVWKTFIVVPMRENVIKERLGKFAGVLKPGFHFMIPFVDRAAYRHETREQAIDIPPQTCITRDNIQVEVDGIVYLKVMNAKDASYGIGDYRAASINLAQTTMRSEIGKLTLDGTFSEREMVNDSIVREIDKASNPWGIKMTRYEIMNIAPSQHIIDTMEKQMEAERFKRAEITMSTGQKEYQINVSEGERQEAINLSEGDRQKCINEAEGRASEITALAEASAEGIRMISEAINKPGGHIAVRTRLVEQFIQEFGNVLEKAQVSVVPSQLAQMQGFFSGIGEVSRSVASPQVAAVNLARGPKA
jgi:regulator of protease activity HflC (stomatin/prohibitin superfamily)